jgi:hypothetical protein
MKGILSKTKQGWIVKYKYNHLDKGYFTKELQVHFEDAKNLDDIPDAYKVLNDNEIEFDIIEVILSTNDNKVILNDFAKIKMPTIDNDNSNKESWDTVWKDFRRIKNASYSWALLEYLKDNYNPPTKKQN